jgi:uncharacterized damage-inducible protein DinB
MKAILTSITAAAVLVAPACAQSQAAAPTVSPAFAATTGMWRMMTGHFTTAAEEGSDSLYAFRPVEGVRSFGELVGHVAGAQYMFCAIALGEEVPDEGAVEGTAKSKAELVAALKASTEYCNRAYALPDAELAAPATIFGQANTRMGALVMNSNHNGEHYGNMVVYLRINGIVPPSSRRGM